MRRIAQLASLAIVREVPEPSFIELEDESVGGGARKTPVQQLEEERNFALTEVIASWEENGWQLRDGVRQLWVRSFVCLLFPCGVMACGDMLLW